MGERDRGAGWAFPVTVADGDVVSVTGEDDVETAIELILGTAPGERLMRPEFGCAIHERTFSAVTPATLNRIETAVREALSAHEPRIAVESVDATRGDDPGSVLIDVGYSLRSTDERSTVRYPFSLREGDG